MKLIYTFIICLLTVHFLSAQQECNDPHAKNTGEIEACEYKKTRKIFRPKTKLEQKLEENSGLLSWNGSLWTFNDSGADAVIYKVNPQTGKIIQTVYISNAINKDWEDITEDENHIYIGDFGNNRGNRKDLAIYKIKKSDLQATTQNVEAEKITFFYPEQQDFKIKKEHHWDCEAFFYQNEAFHFFTKNRDNAKTYHYSIPAKTGHHPAQLLDSLDVQCQITAADINLDGSIVLIGYTPFKLFMWIVWDYEGEEYFTGNTRKIRLGNFMVHGQIEGVCFTNGVEGYISAEGFKRKKQHIRKFDLKKYLK